MAFVFAPAGIGLVIGSIFMPHVSRFLGKSRAVLGGSIGLAIIVTLLPLITTTAHNIQPNGWNSNPLVLFLIAFFMFLAGFALDFINIPAQTAIQEQTPDWIKGRVLALQLVLYNACSIPIILFIGAIADLFSLNHVLYLLAVAVACFGVWGVYYERKHPPYRIDKNNVQDVKEPPTPETITP
jgi:MFS family permease